MFIHWGVYAVPAGSYKEERSPGIGEWIMWRERIPVEEYRDFARDFNPVHYDPEAWAQLAKQAGMRYIVITSKHHDGFALFPSAVSDWDVVDASPYGKDLIGPLEQAAREAGLKFGLYFSQDQDWVNPGGSQSRFKEGEGWDPAQLGDFDEFLGKGSIPQTVEILTRYTPDILWWDTPRWMTEERAERFLPLLRLVPGIIHNDRLSNEHSGDTITPERSIPATGFPDRDWEVCMTMNETWGYVSYDQDWKSAEVLIHQLCDIASKGGNFLLNISPRADGTIPQPIIDRLETIGAWMEVNSEAIYGTTASPMGSFDWGRSTVKLNAASDGGTVYLHIFYWPEDGVLDVPGFGPLPTSARLLGGSEALAFEPFDSGKGLRLHLPKEAPGPYANVVRVDFAIPADFEEVLPSQDETGVVRLTPGSASLHSSYKSVLQFAQSGGTVHIENRLRDNTWIGWRMVLAQAGRFTVQAEIAAEKEVAMTFQLKDQAANEVRIPGSGDPDRFTLVDLGTLMVDAPGAHEFELRAVRKSDQNKLLEELDATPLDWHPIKVRRIVLTPTK